MAGERTRFDVAALHALAGDRVFARGEAYYRAGHVEILNVEAEHVRARVAGTELYQVQLTGHGAGVDGACSCPAFSDRGFCKHLVATALAVNAMRGDGPPAASGMFVRICDHLEGLGVAALVDLFMDLAERDPALFSKLEMTAAAASDDDKTLEARFRKAIKAATRTRGFVDYRAAPEWAAGVGAMLDSLADLVSAGRAALAQDLVTHAIDRIERAIEEVDDSDGHAGMLLERARDIHLAACRAACPDPEILARDLFARETGGEYGTFRNAAEFYADVLGEAGHAIYRELATAAWDKLPPRTGMRQDDHELSHDHYRLASILDFFAERDGDVAVRIALRAEDLSSPRHYLHLAAFCLDHGRDMEALHYAEEGLWVFEDARPDERLVALAADLLDKAGRPAEAEAHLWRAFDKTPSLDLYRRLRRHGGADARDRALEALRGCLDNDKRSLWFAPADLFVRILIEEQMFDTAWTVVQEHGITPALKEDLAMASEAKHPGQALAVYAAGIKGRVEAGGNANYHEAHELLARMAGLQGKSAQAAYIEDLKMRFRRKRNFMKLLG